MYALLDLWEIIFRACRGSAARGLACWPVAVEVSVWAGWVGLGIAWRGTEGEALRVMAVTARSGRHGDVGLGEVGQAALGAVRRCWAAQRMVGRGKERGTAWQARRGKNRQGTALQGRAGQARLRWVRLGMVRHGEGSEAR